MRRRTRILAAAALALAATPLAGAAAFLALDRAYPLPPMAEPAISAQVLDRNGKLLRAFATEEGRWRLPAKLADVDPQFVAMLVAYEDKRFRDHHGVDPVAVVRAAWQFATSGRIVSGGSTLTMQLARLTDVGGGRSLAVKARQMFRALQIERRLTKDEILERYLTLAPYGGNIEGVRAASLAWFGKEPRKLLLSEAALLVALPQSPETRRPDRHPKAAKAARDRVLQRMADAGVIEPTEIARASAARLSSSRRGLPALAPHLAEAAVRAEPDAATVTVTVDRDIQKALEAVGRNAARRLGPKLSLAMILADSRSGDILAEVGSADYFDTARAGWVDMTRVPRSPGSTLKPFIYGLALEEGIVVPETMMRDRPSNFAGYRPENFDTTYQGDVTVREALQMSLNVPAVQLLESVGPAALMQRLRRTGAEPVLPKEEQPGLAIGLGGIGLSLADLVQAYAALANGGNAVTLSDGVNGARAPYRLNTVLTAKAAWQVGDILSGVPAPATSASRAIAYKTGTSYGYRDAWSIGFDGRYVLGVWVGRADNGPVPGSTGGGVAAPILFEAFARSGLKPAPFRAAPRGARTLAAAELPQGLKRFVPKTAALVPVAGTSEGPEIVYPPQGARVELANASDGDFSPLVLKLQGGKAPFRWIANGRPLDGVYRRRTAAWVPDGKGFSKLTVIDAAGKATTVDVLVQ
ncbi:MAG: penicillin-binding protein 1C [Brucellaceae bacterium]|nr:penicillin-binding protein 1C [Brucellaceae bacterium]